MIFFYFSLLLNKHKPCNKPSRGEVHSAQCGCANRRARRGVYLSLREVTSERRCGKHGKLGKRLPSPCNGYRQRLNGPKEQRASFLEENEALGGQWTTQRALEKKRLKQWAPCLSLPSTGKIKKRNIEEDYNRDNAIQY